MGVFFFFKQKTAYEMAGEGPSSHLLEHYQASFCGFRKRFEPLRFVSLRRRRHTDAAGSERRTPVKIYMAGPLFTPYHRAFIARKAQRLREAGFICYVPH